MATSSISGADLTKLRSDQYIDDIAIHVTPLVTIQSGLITAIPTLSPFIDITWDGSTTGIELEQAVRITNGSTLKTWAVIRKLPAGSTLFISTTPLGSSGVATLIENPIEVGDTVTVYSHRPLWGLYSRIDEAEFFKQWDLVYTDQNENPPPIANAGTWQVAKLASGETTHTFTLPREGVDSDIAFSGATITGILWTLPTGVTLGGGFALTDSIIDVNAEAGYHLVSREVTDSNANTHTAHLWLFVSDGTTGTSLSERHGIDEMSGSSTRQGTEISFRITGDNLQDVLFPGAGIVIRQWIKFNDVELTDGILIDTFVLYIHPEGLEFTHDGEIGAANVRMVSPAILADTIVQPVQELSEVANPSNWAECTSLLSNPQFFLFYSIRWHTPPLLSMHDFDAPFTTPRIEFETYSTQSLGAAMKVPAMNIAGNIGSTTDGKTIMRDNPLYMNNADRNAVATIITWLAEDIDPDRGFNYLKRFGSGISEAITGGFAYDGTKKAWAAIKRWNQGGGVATLPNFWVTVAQGLARITEVVGHFYAEQNSDTKSIPLNLNGLQDIIDPSLMLWNVLTVSSDFDPYGVGFANTRILPISVQRTWTLDPEHSLELTLEVQPETFGQAGEELPISNVNSYLSNGFSPTIAAPFEPNIEGNSLGSQVIVNDDNGKMAIAKAFFSQAIPSWDDLSAALNNETVADFTADWNSEYFAGNNPSLPLAIYAITISGTSLKIYRFNDILGSTIATLLHTYTMNDSSCTSEARIECSQSVPTYVSVGWHDQTGTEFGYSDDGGATWQAKANVGDTVSDTANDNAPLGMAIDGTNTIISAPDSTPEYGLYKATTVGGAFSAVTNTERASAPQPMIKITPEGAIAYTSVLGGGNTIIVDFDAGYSSYTIDSSPNVTHSEPASGNPGNCVQYFASGTISSSNFCRVDIALGGTFSVTGITFDIWYDNASTPFMSVRDQTSLLYDLRIDAGDPPVSTWGNLDYESEILENSDPTIFPFSATNVQMVFRYPGFTGTRIIRVDNIIVSATGIGGETILFKVSPFTGAAVWTDITPASDEAPERPHDLSIDVIDNQVLDAVSGNSNNWYTSGDGGDNWGLSEASSNKRAFLTAGETLLAGGDGEVVLSLDSAANFDDKTGNLSTVWGSVGTIKRAQAL